MTHVITQPCCNDGSCADVCPVDCIAPVRGTYLIDPATCIDCGACVDACPVDAITTDDRLDAAGRDALDLALALSPVVRAPRPGPRTPAPVPGRIAVAPRVAVVGTGPAAVYTVVELLARTDGRARVTVLDRLSTPGGLARFGVAPDHPSTRRFGTLVARTLRRPQVELRLGVEVGRDVSAADLLDDHDAVVHAVGAPVGRELDLPGADLPGVITAAEVVGWYNGHPDHLGAPDLRGPDVVVLGSGNVALDVARILTGDVTALARTELSPAALEVLSGSGVEQVHVVARRGPADAAFTLPELLGLDRVPGVQVLASPPDHVPAPPERTPVDTAMAERVEAAVEAYAARRPDPDRRRIVLHFGRTPEALLGPDRVRGVRFARADGGTEDLPADLVVQAVGHRGRPVDGLPFDTGSGTVPHRRGRVVDRPGHYVVGWIKRGPSGGIGDNRSCAEETVGALLDDLAVARSGSSTGSPTSSG